MVNVLEGNIGRGADDNDGNSVYGGTFTMNGGSLTGSARLCTAKAEINQGTAAVSSAEYLTVNNDAVVNASSTVKRLTMNNGSLTIDAGGDIGLGNVSARYCNNIVINGGVVDVTSRNIAIGAKGYNNEASGVIQFNGGTLRAKNINDNFARPAIGSEYENHDIMLQVTAPAGKQVTVNAGANEDKLKKIAAIIEQDQLDKTYLNKNYQVWELTVSQAQEHYHAQCGKNAVSCKDEHTGLLYTELTQSSVSFNPYSQAETKYLYLSDDVTLTERVVIPQNDSA